MTAGHGLSIRIIGAVAIIIAVALAFISFVTSGHITNAAIQNEENEKRYVDCSNAVNQLQEASDHLTEQVRLFVDTGRVESMTSYVDELLVNKRRDLAVSTLKANLEDENGVAELETALAYSDELAQREIRAMRLACDYYGIEDIPDTIAKARYYDNEEKMSASQKFEEAKSLVLGQDYASMKNSISKEVQASSQALLDMLYNDLDESNRQLQILLLQQRISIALLLCVVMVLVLVLLLYVLKPLSRYIRTIKSNDPLEPAGSYELHYLADAYNQMYEDNTQRLEQLRRAAERDPLTGIGNRNAYDSFLATHTRNVALLLVDIDHFKEFNEVYGHDTGDAVLVKIAKALSAAFRSTDFPCRIGGDDFAVIMTNMGPTLQDAVSKKMQLVNDMLADDSDGVPLVTLSVGVAFSDEGMNDRDIFIAADKALGQVKGTTKNGIAFYE